jgi:hypothetical protein
MPFFLINNINKLDGMEKLWKIKKFTMSNKLKKTSIKSKNEIIMLINVIINLLENS